MNYQEFIEKVIENGWIPLMIINGEHRYLKIKIFLKTTDTKMIHCISQEEILSLRDFRGVYELICDKLVGLNWQYIGYDFNREVRK